jgi:hypothetical protein
MGCFQRWYCCGTFRRRLRQKYRSTRSLEHPVRTRKTAANRRLAKAERAVLVFINQQYTPIVGQGKGLRALCGGATADDTLRAFGFRTVGIPGACLRRKGSDCLA